MRALREEKRLSQGAVQKRTDLLRCYLARLEDGHTVPSIDTIQRIAEAVAVPLYQVFYEGGGALERPPLRNSRGVEDITCGISDEEAHFLRKLRPVLGRLSKRDWQLLLVLAGRMANHPTQAS